MEFFEAIFWAPIIAAGISAAASGGSALAGSRANSRANAANLAATQANNETQLKIAARNIAHDKEFAQYGVRWRTNDARKAGIHPLAAMGAQISQPNPVSAFTQAAQLQSKERIFSNLGQDISRAAMAAATDQNRYARAMKKETLKNAQLKNQALQAEIDLTRSQLGPSIPDARLSGNNSPEVSVAGRNALRGKIRVEPQTVVTHAKRGHFSEPTWITKTGYAKTRDGGLRPVPASEMKRRIEDSWQQWQADAENVLLPNLGSNGTKPPYNPGKGREWYWRYDDQAWHTRKKQPKSRDKNRSYWSGFKR
jgi:hypothetical protein